MVASARVMALSNKSDEISVLAEFLRNPNLIASLEEEVVKLNKLTDEQEQARHESLIMLQQRESLAKELNQKKEDIRTTTENHKKDIDSKTADFEKWRDEELEKIKVANKDLDDRKSAHEAEDTRLRQYENKLKETAAKMQGLVGG